MMRCYLRLGVALALGLVLAAEVSAMARAKKHIAPAVLIVPARMRAVQLALDLAELRPISLLAYRGAVRADDPLLFAWRNKAWHYLDLNEFRALNFVRDLPGSAWLVGDDDILPLVLAQAPGWGIELQRIKSMDAAELINRMDAVFKFTPQEWRWLAARHGLTLQDVNEPLRQHDPYAIPRSQLPLKNTGFNLEPGEPAPALIIERTGPDQE